MKSRYFDFKFIIGIFIIIVLILGFYGPISEHIYSLNYYYVVLGFGTLLAIMFIKHLKFYLLLGKIRNLRLSFKSYFMGQFVNEIAPMGTGDVTKAYIIRKYSNKSFGSSLSIPYMERIIDISVLSLFAILSSVFLFFATITSYVSLVFILILVMAVGFFMLATFPVKIALLVKRILELLRRVVPVKFIENLVSKVEVFILEMSKDFKDALGEFRNRKIFVLFIIMLALFDWILEGVCQVFFLNSLGYTIPIPVSVGIVAISWLVSIPSMIPGGLGIREAVLSLLFASVGVPFSVALVSVLIYRGFVVLIFGSSALISLKVNPVQ